MGCGQPCMEGIKPAFCTESDYTGEYTDQKQHTGMFFCYISPWHKVQCSGFMIDYHQSEQGDDRTGKRIKQIAHAACGCVLGSAVEHKRKGRKGSHFKEQIQGQQIVCEKYTDQACLGQKQKCIEGRFPFLMPHICGGENNT
ncbi:hypothetical protein IMSAG013_01412 [Clostridiales bacterium]|nr:hypothetical protein IMSAG013_01412 [Clostridiales bacterium]